MRAVEAHVLQESPRSRNETWGALRLADGTWRAYNQQGPRARVCAHVHPSYDEAAACLDATNPFADWSEREIVELS